MASRKPKSPPKHPPFPNPERPWPGERRPIPGGAVRATRIRERTRVMWREEVWALASRHGVVRSTGRRANAERRSPTANRIRPGIPASE